MAMGVMKEIGIDISGQYSKDAAQFLGQSFHYVIYPPGDARAVLNAGLEMLRIIGIEVSFCALVGSEAMLQTKTSRQIPLPGFTLP